MHVTIQMPPAESPMLHPSSGIFTAIDLLISCIKFLEMKKLLTLLCFSLCILIVKAQNLVSFKDAATGKFGFKTTAGKLVVNAIYDDVTNFYEGMIAVNTGAKPALSGYGMQGGLWGFIDSTGKKVIDLIYQRALYFKEGLAAVQKNDKWGFIDKAGKMVIAPKYEDVGTFSDGMAKMTVNKKSGYVNKSGVEVIAPQYTFASEFSEGLAAVSLEGTVSSSGNTVSIFGEFGYIDKTGKLVIPYQFTEAYAFGKNGTAWVYNGGREYRIDRTGEEVK